MELTVGFPGLDGPFEGDLTLELAALPVGARVTASTLTVRPIGDSSSGPFEERLTIASDTGDFGTTKSVGANAVDIDFHARRTLVSVTLNEASPPATDHRPKLQVDVGGLFLEVGAAGQVPKPPTAEGFPVQVGGALPGLTVSRFRLTGTADVQAVTVRSVPSGLSARIGSLPPFWTRIGELTQPFTIPDWASVLIAALLDATVRDGAYVLPLTVHSDTLCRLEVTWTIGYRLEAGGLPAGVPDVLQSFDYDGLPLEGQPAATVALPAGATVVSTAGRIRGTFDSTRVMLGPVGTIDAPSAVAVSGNRAQAQPLLVDQDTSTDSIDLLLSAGGDGAQLQVQVLEDVDGRPWNVPLLAVPARLTLPGSRDPRPQWVTAVLGERFRFRAAQRYWVIVQALTGTALWSVESVPATVSTTVPATGPAGSADPGLQWSQDGGLSWRVSTAEGVEAPMRALLRLRAAPPAFEIPAHLTVGTPTRVEVTAARVVAPSPTDVPLDRLRAAGRLDVDLDLPELAAAVQAAADTTPRPVPAVEHLTNGDFSIWITVTHEGQDDHQLPDAWQVTAGPVSRPRGCSGIVIGSDEKRSALSQVVAVAPAGDYVLSVTTCGAPEAAADLIWRGGACTGPRTDVLALDPVGNGRLASTYRLRSNAPPGAAQVEVRLRTIVGPSLTVGSVSLRGVDSAVMNGDFREPVDSPTANAPTGWAVTPVDAQPVVRPSPLGVVLGTAGADQITLTQPVPVRPGPFRLEVDALGLVPPGGGDGPPQLRVRWLGANAASGADWPVISFTATSFGSRLAQGLVPAGATTAELALVLPAGVMRALDWSGVRLSQPSPVNHAINVVAQGPGEVRVAGIAVQYDVPAPAPPGLPAGGACPVTPLDAVPGAPSAEQTCPCCGRTGAQARLTTVARWAAATGPVIPPPPVRTQPVDVVRGVGPIRAARLAQAGLPTLAALGAAHADAVHAVLPELSLAQAEALISDARSRLAAGHQVRWADLQPDGSTPTVIAVAGTTPDGSTWRMPAQEAAGGVASGRWSLHVRHRSGPIAVVLQGGGLRAARGPGEPDLLLTLPPIPSRP